MERLSFAHISHEEYLFFYFFFSFSFFFPPYSSFYYTLSLFYPFSLLSFKIPFFYFSSSVLLLTSFFLLYFSLFLLFLPFLFALLFFCENFSSEERGHWPVGFVSTNAIAEPKGSPGFSAYRSSSRTIWYYNNKHNARYFFKPGKHCESQATLFISELADECPIPNANITNGSPTISSNLSMTIVTLSTVNFTYSND